MSKNRSMQAKNAKAKKWAIAESASQKCYQIQCEGIQSRNNKALGIVLWADARKSEMQELAMSLADTLTLNKYPVWERTVYVAIVDKKHVKAEFSEESRYWSACYEKAISLLDRGMSAENIVKYWSI